MWADAQRDGRPAEYRWCPPLNAETFGWRPILECRARRAVTLPYRKTQNLNAKWILHLAKFRQRARAAENVYTVYPSRRRPNIVQSLDERRCCINNPTRETRWNLMGCPKRANRSEPVMGRSSPYCGNLWMRYCYLTSFSWLSIHALLAKTQADKVVRWCPDGEFLRYFASCIFSEPRAAHFRHAF